MYYYIDLEKLKIIFFNELATGRTKGNSITVNNVWYRFNDNLEIEELGIDNENEKAFVLTTKGFIDFEPAVTIQCNYGYIENYGCEITNLNYVKNQIEEGKINKIIFYKDLEQTYLEHVLFLCNGFVCINELENATRLSKNNFIAESTVYQNLQVDNNMKILSDDKWWIFDFSDVKTPAVLTIEVNNERYRIFYVYGGCDTVKIRKGTCMYISSDGKIFCL